MFRQYYSSEAPNTLLGKPNVLSVVTYNHDCSPPAQPGTIPCGLSSLSSHLSEVIECDGEVVRGKTGNCLWSKTQDLICSAIWISPDDCFNITDSAEKAYIALMSHLIEAGYPNPIRLWNFIPDINLGEGDREAYKQFCTGRLKAFNRIGILPDAFPAASALGHHSRGAVIYALATPESGVHYENPKQRSADHYPRQYGPSSPSFARATSVEIGREHWAFISGTASILGHETQSPGDIHQQLEVTLSNIDHLAEHIHQDTRAFNGIRVYLRHEEDLEVSKKALEQHFPNCEITYTKADICRANLLVEIEAALALPTL